MTLPTSIARNKHSHISDDTYGFLTRLAARVVKLAISESTLNSEELGPVMAHNSDWVHLGRLIDLGIIRAYPISQAGILTTDFRILEESLEDGVVYDWTRELAEDCA